MRIDRACILPRRSLRQPVPFAYSRGDCGACVLGGLLGLDVHVVYSALIGEVKSIGFLDMERALNAARGEGLIDRLITAMPLWPADVPAWTMAFGLPSWYQGLHWFAYVRLALDAGYYAIACVDHGRHGPFAGGPDHWVLLVGVRDRWEEKTDSDGNLYEVGQHELLVSCSSTSTPDEEWVEAHDFLRDRGGFNLLLARPA